MSQQPAEPHDARTESTTEARAPAGSAVVRPTPARVLVAVVQQLRPKQWAKNGLLYAALIFSGAFTQVESILAATLGFGAFCLVSSAGYVLNDYLDREADRRHPKKRHRPIASGALPVPVALVELVVIAAAGLGLAAWISPWFLAVTVAYLSTTLSYSFYFKHHVILDVMFIAMGFVWRAVAGALAIGVAVSPWFFLCTAFLALFLGFNKRRAELVQLGEKGGTRKNLADYSPQMLDQFQSIVTGNVVLSYSLYAVMGPSPWMAGSIPFVLYGIFRYIYLVDQKGEGGAPEDTLFTDKPLIATVALYLVTVVGILILAPPAVG